MMRKSNTLIGMLNFLTFLIAVPILGAGIWLSNKASTDCLRFLQWPLVVAGVAIMVLSLAGFAGACYRLTWLLRLYLAAMFLVILVLLFFVVFAFVVTDGGGGRAVAGKGFEEYRLGDYSGWLKDRVEEEEYWTRIVECLRKGKVCGGMDRYVKSPETGALLPEPAEYFYQRKLTPLESGCCKPPSSCGYVYVNETFWNPSAAGMAVADVDCGRWSNDQSVVCYGCDSCKAGVLATVKKSWRKAAVVTVVVLVVLVVVYAVAVAAHRNNRRRDNDEGYGGGMTKSHPSRFHF